MSIFEYKNNQFIEIDETTFSAWNVREKEDIQKFLCNNIHVISDDLLVITEEFNAWKNSDRRIDILCIDGDGKFVIIELKREESKTMIGQAISYKALLEKKKLSIDQAIQIHQKFLNENKGVKENAKDSIFEFLEREESEAMNIFGNEARIILISPDFSNETIITVKSQIDKGDVIRCVRIVPYELPNGKRIVDFDDVDLSHELAEIDAHDRDEDLLGYYIGYDLKIDGCEVLKAKGQEEIVLHTVKKLFELGCDPEEINEACGKFKQNCQLLLGVDSEIEEMSEFHRLARENAKKSKHKILVGKLFMLYWK